MSELGANKLVKSDSTIVGAYVGTFLEVPSRSDQAIVELIVCNHDDSDVPEYLLRYLHHEGMSAVFGRAKTIEKWFKTFDPDMDAQWKMGVERMKSEVMRVIGEHSG